MELPSECSQSQANYNQTNQATKIWDEPDDGEDLLAQFIFPIFNITQTSSYYLSFGAIEVVCTSLIGW